MANGNLGLLRAWMLLVLPPVLFGLQEWSPLFRRLADAQCGKCYAYLGIEAPSGIPNVTCVDALGPAIRMSNVTAETRNDCQNVNREFIAPGCSLRVEYDITFFVEVECPAHWDTYCGSTLCASGLHWSPGGVDVQRYVKCDGIPAQDARVKIEACACCDCSPVLLLDLTLDCSPP